jgi:hypothetical protein
LQLWRGSLGAGTDPNLGIGVHVDLGNIVGPQSLLAELFLGGADLCLGAHGDHLLLILRSATCALSGTLVPADLGADPLTATLTTAELLFDLGNSRLQGTVMGRAADRSLNVISGIARRAEKTPEDAACRLKKAASGANHRGSKGRHVAAIAMVTMKLELISTVGGVVRVVADKLDHRHFGLIASR